MTKPYDKIPKWLLEQEGLTTREYKEWKRNELSTVLDAIDRFAYCAAYLPPGAFEDYDMIQFYSRQLMKKLSQKEWGR